MTDINNETTSLISRLHADACADVMQLKAIIEMLIEKGNTKSMLDRVDGIYTLVEDISGDELNIEDYKIDYSF